MTATIKPTDSGIAIRSLRELAGMSTADLAAMTQQPAEVIEQVESGAVRPTSTWVSSTITLIAIELSRSTRFSEKMAQLVAPASSASLAEVAREANLGFDWSRKPEGWLGLAATTTAHATAPYVFRQVAGLMSRGVTMHLFTGAQAVPRSAWDGSVFAEFGRASRNEYWRDFISIGGAASFHQIVVELAQIVEANPEPGKHYRFGPPAPRCPDWCTRHYVQWDACTRPIGKMQPAGAKTPVRVVLRQNRIHGIPAVPRVEISGPTTRLSLDEKQWIDSLAEEAFAIEPTAVTR